MPARCSSTMMASCDKRPAGLAKEPGREFVFVARVRISWCGCRARGRWPGAGGRRFRDSLRNWRSMFGDACFTASMSVSPDLADLKRIAAAQQIVGQELVDGGGDGGLAIGAVALARRASGRGSSSRRIRWRAPRSAAARPRDGAPGRRPAAAPRPARAPAPARARCARCAAGPDSCSRSTRTAAPAIRRAGSPQAASAMSSRISGSDTAGLPPGRERPAEIAHGELIEQDAQGVDVGRGGRRCGRPAPPAPCTSACR